MGVGGVGRTGAVETERVEARCGSGEYESERNAILD